MSDPNDLLPQIPGLTTDHNDLLSSKLMGEYPISEKITEPGEVKPNLNYDQMSQAWKDTYKIAETLKIDPSNVDVETGGKFWDRLDYSLSDTDKEVTNKFHAKHPQGVMLRVPVETGTRLVYKEDAHNDIERWKTVEDYGFSGKDVADIVGSSIPALTSIALGIATEGASVPGQVLAYSGGYAAGYTGKEAVEQARGYQLEPILPSQGVPFSQTTTARGLAGTAETGLMTGVIGLGSRMVSPLVGKGVFETSPKVTSALRDIEKAKQAGLGLEKLSAGQMLPENMIIQRLEAQARSTSKVAQFQMENQLKSTSEALKEIKSVPITQYQAGQKLLKETKRIYNQELNSLKNQMPRVTPRQANLAATEGMRNWQQAYKSDISMSYRALDEIVQREQPIFDLNRATQGGSSVREQVNRIRDYALAQTDDATINVAGTPIGRLVGIIDDINQIADVQTNYYALKNLRTRAGELIEQWPWESNVNKGQAKALYRTLTQAIENPVNSAPEFVSAHSAVSARARAYYEALDSPSIRAMLKNENTGQLVKKLSAPNSLTDEVISEMNSSFFPREQLLQFKAGVKNEILFSGKSALESIKKYKQSDPEAWRFLVPKSEERTLVNVATKVDNLNKSNFAKVVSENSRTKNTVDNLLLKGNISKADIQYLTNNLSPRGKQAARAGIFEDILDKAQIETKGIVTIDKQKLTSTLDDYKKSGLWDSPVLTNDDRIKLKGLESYVSLLRYGTKDPGVSLEAAQAITQLKHPSSFISGAHKLAFNSVMAKFLTSDLGTKILVNQGGRSLKGDALIRSALIVDGLAEGTELGEGDYQLSDYIKMIKSVGPQKENQSQ